MGSIKIVLRQKQDKSGQFPLAIRITKDRKATFMHVGQSIFEKDWDEKNQRVKKSHPNSVRLNNFLLQKLAEANDRLLELETEKKNVTSQAVKQSLKPTFGLMFYPQAERYIETLKLGGKYVQMKSETSRFTAFKEFLKNQDIAFSDISVNQLEHFRAWLTGKRQLKERSIINHFLFIRAVFSQAIKENPKLEKHYPFGKGKISLRFPQSLKIGLSIDEVKKLESFDFGVRTPQDHARNIWLLSFYFAGVRVSDLLKMKWSDFQDDRLHYTMGKNDKSGSLKMTDKAKVILAKYEELKDSTDLIFPELRVLPTLDDEYEVQRKTAFADKNLNKQLKKVAQMAGINKKLSMHIARHTFGNISGDKIPIQMLQKLYRHSNITTTIGYQANFIHKESDEALEKVLGF
jgi:integrase/recombinase XerD